MAFDGTMKILAYLVLLLGIGFGIDAARDQISGHASALSPSRGSQVVEASKNEKPDEFQGIMAYQWIRAAAAFGGGLFLISWIRRSERLDPFHA